jgi:hypothetical protein
MCSIWGEGGDWTRGFCWRNTVSSLRFQFLTFPFKPPTPPSDQEEGDIPTAILLHRLALRKAPSVLSPKEAFSLFPLTLSKTPLCTGTNSGKTLMLRKM